ncbi:hypothetical protein B9Z19DRAFT_1068895 [Tuber borchii]|uniref:Uncharacterized protein n=1 Tax=Tuber borchii TaxID=42251 RepID=A0A2T6ZDJ8_TUBBO|nr:hypothetical protein B9Z19DRAFT_1068895 [Tuber borchii]
MPITTTSSSTEAGSSPARAEADHRHGGRKASSRPLKPLKFASLTSAVQKHYPPDLGLNQGGGSFVSTIPETSVKFTGLTREVQREGPVRPLQAHLDGLTQAEIALAVVDLLNLHYQHREVLGGWEKKIDAESDHSSILSEHYLREMAKLANRGITLLDAQEVLNYVMKTRIARPGKGVRTTCVIMIIARPHAPTTISSASCDGTTPPNGLPSPQPTPSSKRPRSGSNHNQLSQTTHHISSPIQSPMQSPVHSCRQSPALPDTGEPRPSPRSPSPRTGHVTPPVQSVSDSSPTPGTYQVDSNEGDIDPNEFQPLAAGQTSPHQLLITSIARKKKESTPKRHSTSKGRSAPKRHALQVPIPALDSPLQSPPPSPPPVIITHPLAQSTSKKRLYSEYASEDNTLPLRDATPTLDSPLQSMSNSASAHPATITQSLDYTPEITALPLSHIFSLPDNWAYDSGIHTSVLERGFYNSPDALIQHPRVYLTALAAMKTTNHRLISLPVPLIDCSDCYQIRDSLFPFEKYIASEKEVLGTRLLYPLNASTFRIGTISTQERVEAWWTISSGDLQIAASQIDPEDVLTVPFQAGELIAMPPQLLWSAKADNAQDDCSQGHSSDSSQIRSKIAEIRYISLTPDQMLEFGYWPTGSYDQISRLGRGNFPGGKRPQTAIQMRGVWAIGDALLGLTSWDSLVVQVELRELFNAPAGSWFNAKFVNKIEASFDRKLTRMVKTLEKVNKLAFSTAG